MTTCQTELAVFTYCKYKVIVRMCGSPTPESSANCTLCRVLRNMCRSEACVWTCWDVCCTWSQLFNAAIAAADVHREEVFEPVNLWVRVAACRAQHRSGARSLHDLQLGSHVYGGEAMRYLVLCAKDINKQTNKHWNLDMISGWWQLRRRQPCSSASAPWRDFPAHPPIQTW